MITEIFRGKLRTVKRPLRLLIASGYSRTDAIHILRLYNIPVEPFADKQEGKKHA